MRKKFSKKCYYPKVKHFHVTENKRKAFMANSVETMGIWAPGGERWVTAL